MAVVDGGVESVQAMGEAMAKPNGKPTRSKQAAAKENVEPKKQQQPKEKKPRVSSKSNIDHPPYLQMVMEAISSLKERGGSSQHAIAKYLEEKYKTGLPAAFKRILSIQLRNMSNTGKLTKVKNSFKLPSKSSPTEPKKAAAAPKKTKTATKTTTGKDKSKPAAAVRVSKVKISPKKPKAASIEKKTKAAAPKSKSPAAAKASARSVRASTRSKSAGTEKQGTPNKPKKAVTASKRARRVAKA